MKPKPSCFLHSPSSFRANPSAIAGYLQAQHRHHVRHLIFRGGIALAVGGWATVLSQHALTHSLTHANEGLAALHHDPSWGVAEMSVP